MGGSLIDDDWEIASLSNAVRTVVLVGRTGNGKSATGNSIIGSKVFKSRRSSSGVTSTCELYSTLLPDGQKINVIDTPGLFDSSDGFKFFGEEIVKCIGLAQDGIHAILVVYSIRTRFSKEEESTLRSLQILFGNKIVDYMIVVFTGGDELEDDETLEDYLASACPTLKDILFLCHNRYVLFDNKTKDRSKCAQQVQQLLSLVNVVVAQNGGKPYTDDLFIELKKGAKELQKQLAEVESRKELYSKQEITLLKEQMTRSHEDQFKRIIEMVEQKLLETTTRLEQQLAAEQAARIRAEEEAHRARKKSEDEIRALREELRKKEEERKEGIQCAIL